MLVFKKSEDKHRLTNKGDKEGNNESNCVIVRIYI